jgi:predicted DNA-binding ribbon-helix-helix protein
MTLQPRDNGKFQNKSDQPREVRSIRATDRTWIKLGDYAESRSITRADLLEELADNLNTGSEKQLSILTTVDMQTIISNLEECLNLKGNATNKIKTELRLILNMLTEKSN